MSRVYTSWIIDAPRDTVWEVVHDFFAIDTWVVRIRRSVQEGGSGPGAVGAIRHLTLDPDGRETRERLVSYDALEHSYRYEFPEGAPYPVENYLATVRVIPLTEDDRSVLEWYAEFDAEPEVVAKVQQAFSRLYAEFVADLRAHIAAKAPGQPAQ